jgi:ubiquinone/menaquinone biosynthesis C-methylase UbiE
MPELDPAKQAVANTYNLASAGYNGRWLRFWTDSSRALIDAAGLEPGQRVLDLGTGTGEAALAAAERVGKSGRVLGLDIAEEMLAEARKRSAGKNIEYRVHDIDRVDELTEKFDVVLSSHSIFFLPDMCGALARVKKVVEPAGRLAVSTWGKSAFQPQSEMFRAAISKFPVKLPEKFGWQRIPDAPALKELISSAGFRNLEVSTKQLGYPLADADAWWEIVWNSGFRGPVAQLSPADLEKFKAAHLAEISGMKGPEGIDLNLECHFAVATP